LIIAKDIALDDCLGYCPASILEGRKDMNFVTKAMLEREAHEDALESYKETRWMEIEKLSPEAIAKIAVDKLGADRVLRMFNTWLFDELAEHEFVSSLEPEPADECEPAYEGGAA
jgi:hypothetical protein